MKLKKQQVLSEMKKNNMTQKDLADKCGYSVSTINRMLQGKLLSKDEANKIAAALKLTIDEITYEENSSAAAVGVGLAVGAGLAAIIGALIVNAKKDNSLTEEDKNQLIDLLKK